MLPSVAVGQLRVEQAIALSAEPPIPRCLHNPYSGYWPGHSSATGLAGTGDSSKRDWEEWVLWRGWFDTVPFDRLRAGFPRTPDRLTTNGGASVWELRGRWAGLRRRPYKDWARRWWVVWFDWVPIRQAQGGHFDRLRAGSPRTVGWADGRDCAEDGRVSDAAPTQERTRTAQIRSAHAERLSRRNVGGGGCLYWRGEGRGAPERRGRYAT